MGGKVLIFNRPIPQCKEVTSIGLFYQLETVLYLSC